MQNRREFPPWKALQSRADELSSTHLRNLFLADAARFDALHVEQFDLLFDFSRQRLTARTIGLRVDLARGCGLEERIAALFAGEPVNLTERRAAMHMALRNRSGRQMLVEGREVMPEVEHGLARMRELVNGVHEGGPAQIQALLRYLRRWRGN